jgi:hypothetical protein
LRLRLKTNKTSPGYGAKRSAMPGSQIAIYCIL